METPRQQFENLRRDTGQRAALRAPHWPTSIRAQKSPGRSRGSSKKDYHVRINTIMNYVKINIIIFIVNYNYLTMLINSFVYLGFNARTAFEAKEKPRRSGGL